MCLLLEMIALDTVKQFSHANYYSPALKKWGLYWICLVLPWFHDCHSVTFQIKIFVTVFPGTVRPRRLNLGTHVDSGQMYRIYGNQVAGAYSSLYFFTFLSLQFSNIKIFRHISQQLRSLEDWNMVHTWTVGRCIVYTRIRLLVLICPFISSFYFLSSFQALKFLSHFSQEPWGLEDWNMVHTWTVGRCILYTRIRLLVLIHPFNSSFFFLSNFQTLKFFVTLFSGTVGPRRLKPGTHEDSGQMYRVYQNQRAAAYSSLYFFILTFSSHFSQELWDLEDWNLAHTWTVDRCIVYTVFRLLLFICPFISSFFFLSNFQNI